MKKAMTALSIIRFSKKVVIFCISFVTIYTIVAIVFQIMTGEPLSEVLTEKVFQCFLGELGVTGMLKIAENVVEAFGKRMSEDGKLDDNISQYEIKEEILNDSEIDAMMYGTSYNVSNYEPATQSERQD